MIGAEAAGSGYHPIMIDKGGRDHDGGWSYGWIFALVIIFLALVFLWGRRDHGERHHNAVDGILPAMALNGMNHKNHGGHCVEEKVWDVNRDQMREFANLRQEIADKACMQQRENDRYFYEQRAATDRNNYDTLLGFKNNEILGLQNKGDIVTEIRNMRDEMKEEKLREQGNRINFLETVAALQPRPPVPAYFPRYDIPVQHNVYSFEPACHPGHQ